MKLNKLLCIDLEATCGPGIAKDESEIIEIGIAVVDNYKLVVENSAFILVKPEFTRVNNFCTRLTTWKQSDVELGISLREACDILKTTYHSNEYTWCSWGMYDKTQFTNECNRKDITSYPFSHVHFNLKNMFSLLHGFNTMYGEDRAVQKMGFSFTGTRHRGIDDAKNIALLYIDLAKRLRHSEMKKIQV